MKLLLDEHYADVLAEQLRDRGHDVVAVAAAGLAGTADELLLSWADAEERVLLTNNVRHFVPIHSRWVSTGRSHHGIWLTDDRRMPRAKGSLGTYLAVIDERMRAHPEVDAFADRLVWLT